MLVENTREEALKAFLSGSDVRIAVKTENEPMAFIRLKDLIPPDAIYFINVEVEPEDDYEEKVLHVDQGGGFEESSCNRSEVR